MTHRKPAEPSNLKVHRVAVEYAKHLIKEGKINCKDPWEKHEPIAETEDRFLKNHNINEYGKWFLATTEGTDKNTKQHYEFPIGDFENIYREGVITAKKRAAQYKHDLVEKTADELLTLIDKACKA